MTRVLTLIALLAAPPAAQPPPGNDAAARLLGAIDVPLTPEAMKQAGVTEPYAAGELGRPTATRYLRQRAVSALGLVGTDTARQTISETAQKDADEQVRVQAVISLARAFGPSDQEAVAATLRRVAEGAPPPVAKAVRDELDRLYAKPH